jgi:four helix bundle protein
MRRDKQNLIVDLTFNFSLKLIPYCDELQNQKRFVISNQLLKSGTSIGANIREAQNAESTLDFLHKMKIAGKEAEETDYWLTLCNKLPTYPDTEELLSDLKNIHNILFKIISTTKQKS